MYMCVCVYSVALLGHPVDVVSLLGNGLCVALSTIWIYITQLGLTAHKHTHIRSTERGFRLHAKVYMLATLRTWHDSSG